MNRFHLFAYDDYYPGGGLADYKGSFETHEAAHDYLPTAMVDDIMITHAHIALTTEEGSLRVVAHWGATKGWRYPSALDKNPRTT